MKTRNRGATVPPATFVLQRFLPYVLSVAASRVSVAFAAMVDDEFGISLPDWRVLSHVSANREVSVKTIAAHTSMDKPSVSRSVARLVAAGLISRTNNPDDQRLVVLTLTARGSELYGRIVPRMLALERELKREFGARRYAEVRDALVELTSAARQVRGNRNAGA